MNIKYLFPVILAVLITGNGCTSEEKVPPNVLFIDIDDLNEGQKN
jgi:hypothetical protein